MGESELKKVDYIHGPSLPRVQREGTDHKGGDRSYSKDDAWRVARHVTPKMCTELLKLRTRVTIEAKVSCDK